MSVLYLYYLFPQRIICYQKTNKMSVVDVKPAEKVEIQLTRANGGVPWGFRLQGGSDFQTPLSIQSVSAMPCCCKSSLNITQ